MQGQNDTTQQVEQGTATSSVAPYDEVEDQGYVSSAESEATTIRNDESDGGMGRDDRPMLDIKDEDATSNSADEDDLSLYAPRIPGPNPSDLKKDGQNHRKRKHSHLLNDSQSQESGSQKDMLSPPVHSRRHIGRQSPKVKRRHLINYHYLQLLNKEIDEFALSPRYLDSLERHVPYHLQLEGSFVGMVYWSSLEKHVFFEQLGRKSRHNLEAVAACIPTKTVSECFDYLNCLRSGSDELKQDDPRLSCGMDEMPAAWEVSPSFLEQEDTCAQNLETWTNTSYSQRKPFIPEQMTSSSVVYPTRTDLKDISAQPANTFNTVKREVSPDELRSPELNSEKVTEGENDSLLNVPKFIELSSRLYFNRPKEYVGERRRNPGIDKLATWFFDITARIITEKLVKACMDIASSRSQLNCMRGYDPSDQSSLDTIHQTDVWAACRMLHIEPLPSLDFWTTLPRRLGLSTVAYKRKAGKCVPICYEVFEKRLHKYHRRKLKRRAEFLRQEQMRIIQQFPDQEESKLEQTPAEYKSHSSNPGSSFLGNTYNPMDIDSDDQDFPTETESAFNIPRILRRYEEPTDRQPTIDAESHSLSEREESTLDSEMSSKRRKMYQCETDYLEGLDLENSSRYNDITLAWILSGRETEEASSSNDDEEQVLHLDNLSSEMDMPMASTISAESDRPETRIHDNIRLQTIYKLFFGKDMPQLHHHPEADNERDGKSGGNKRRREKQRLRRFMRQWYH